MDVDVDVWMGHGSKEPHLPTLNVPQTHLLPFTDLTNPTPPPYVTSKKSNMQLTILYQMLRVDNFACCVFLSPPFPSPPPYHAWHQGLQRQEEGSWCNSIQLFHLEGQRLLVDVFTCVTCLISMWDVTHAYMQSVPPRVVIPLHVFICVT